MLYFHVQSISYTFLAQFLVRAVEFITQRTTTCFGTLHWPSSRCEIKKKLVNSYTRLMWVVYSGEVRAEVGMRSRMCYVGWVVWVSRFCYCMLF